VVEGDVAGGISGGTAVISVENNLFPPNLCIGIVRRTAKTVNTDLTAVPEIERFLRDPKVNATLPRYSPVPAPRLPATPPNPAKYIDYVRRQTAFIELQLETSGKGSLPEDVDIGDLWIPARTRPPAEAKRAKSRMPADAPLIDVVNRSKTSHRTVVIEGDAGSGKSTFLKRIAYAMLRTRWPAKGRRAESLKLTYSGLPLWIPVKDLEAWLAKSHKGDPPKTSDLAWISEYFESLSAGRRWCLDRRFFEDALHDRENLLLVDGLDEAAPQWRSLLARLIGEASQAFTCGIVVTLRPEAEHAGRLLSGERFPIREMENSEIDLFVTLWTRLVKKHDSASAAAHAAALRENLRRPAIRSMARNPLMLTLLASRPDHDFSPNDFLQYLSVLALWMTSRAHDSRYQSDAGDAAQELAKFLHSETLEPALDFLERAEDKTRLIARRGKSITFRHRSFQEFLAAWRINSLVDPWKPAASFLASRESPEVLRLLAGLMHTGEERLSELFRTLLSTRGKSLERDAYLAGIVGSMLADPAPTRYRLPPDLVSERDALLERVMCIFATGEAALREAPKISLRDRAAAAEALDQAGYPRLPLPTEENYWVRVEGGEFWMGAQKKDESQPDFDPEAFDDEKRKNPVRVGSFWLGKYPVTVHEFGTWLDAENITPDPAMNFEQQRRHPGRPVVKVTFSEAAAYCKWAEGSLPRKGECRLPSEEEWEYAARGPNSLRYPWGNSPTPDEDENRVNACNRLKEPSPVGLFPAGASKRGGIMDLIGNVWEWTDSSYGKGLKVLRGGCFLFNAQFLRAAYRISYLARDRDIYLGFRCVRK
jgi:formylglycine-generating enzyme required for sulfatase activity/energy-coupling factor transporter ATP-binding protein EcfA2